MTMTTFVENLILSLYLLYVLYVKNKHKPRCQQKILKGIIHNRKKYTRDIYAPQICFYQYQTRDNQRWAWRSRGNIPKLSEFFVSKTKILKKHCFWIERKYHNITEGKKWDCVQCLIRHIFLRLSSVGVKFISFIHLLWCHEHDCSKVEPCVISNKSRVGK